MSRWLDNFNEINKRKVEKRIEKLKEEHREYDRNYRDFPYDRYLKAMKRREEEIEELEMFGNPNSAKREVEDYKEELARVRKILGNIHYLALNIDPCDQKSDSNLRKLQNMTSNYECTDYEFMASADSGIW